MTTGAAVHNLDEEHSLSLVFAGSWDTRRKRSGAKSAFLETDVFAQRYALGGGTCDRARQTPASFMTALAATRYHQHAQYRTSRLLPYMAAVSDPVKPSVYSTRIDFGGNCLPLPFCQPSPPFRPFSPS